MKKRLFIAILFILMAGFAIKLQYSASAASDSVDLSKNSLLSQSTASTESGRDSEPSSRPGVRIYLPAADDSEADGIPEDLETTVSVIEEARLNALRKVTAPYFLETAPVALDALIEEESSNAMWTSMVEANIAQAIQSGDFDGSALQDVQCHSTLCKIQMTHEDDAALVLFDEEAPSREALVGPSFGFTRLNDEGLIENTIYLGKYGSDYQMKSAAMERIYEIATGESASAIVPTDEQIDNVAAVRL